MNYSPKVTANCDGTLLIALQNKATTTKYMIYLDQDGFVDGMQQIAEIPASPGETTTHHHLSVVPNTGQASVTAVAVDQNGGSSIANSTVLAVFDENPETPAFTRGLTYQHGTTATGTPCSGVNPPPANTTTAPGKGNSAKAPGKK